MNKVAVITGGTRGIGLGIANILAEKGWSLVLNGMRAVADVQNIMESFDKYSITTRYVQGNIGNLQDGRRILATAVDTFGHINALVNNAGVAPATRADLLETSAESYERVMDINLKGPFFLSQAFANHMIAAKNANPEEFYSIINISSISATIASVNRGEYCISKAGMSMMTKLFAARLGEFDIPVYEVRPGLILTDMTGPVKAKYDQMIEQGLTVQKRWGMPEDVGKAVASLLDQDLPYSTGQVIMVDGGLTVERL